MPAGDEQEAPEIKEEAPETEKASEDIDLEAELLAGAGADDNADVTQLLDGIEGDEELSEINDLLKANDTNEIVDDDMMSMLSDEGLSDEDEEGGEGGDSEGEKAEGEAEDKEEIEEGEEPKKKAKKPKKEKKPKGEESEGGEKKESFLSKILSFFFDEAEEEGEGADGAETLVANPSEQTLENAAVIAESEADGGKKKKKPKKEKKPKPKKPKKPKPPKKPKKPKPPKPPKDPGPPEKKLPKKKVFAVVLFFGSLMLMIVFCMIVFPKAGYISQGQTSYEEGDYSKALESLAVVGKLDEESQFMYDNAAIITQLRRKYDAYSDYMARVELLEALDSLVQGVGLYNELCPLAEQRGVSGAFDEIYAQIVGTLQSSFGVSESQANELLGIDDRVQYTIALLDIVEPDWRTRIRKEIDEYAKIYGETPMGNPINMNGAAEEETAETVDSQPQPQQSQQPQEEVTEEQTGDAAPSGTINSIVNTGGSDPEVITPEDFEGYEGEDSSGDQGDGGDAPDSGSETPAPESEGGGTPGNDQGSQESGVLYEFNVHRNSDGTYS